MPAWRRSKRLTTDGAPCRTAGRSGLDDIWYYLAKESGSIEIADRVVDSITERFFLLARYPHIGRRRDESQAIPARRETGFQSPNFSSRKATWSSVARST